MLEHELFLKKIEYVLFEYRVLPSIVKNTKLQVSEAESPYGRLENNRYKTTEGSTNVRVNKYFAFPWRGCGNASVKILPCPNHTI
jgi:hypothetical protein